MALAPLGWTLFSKVLRFDPTAPEWPGRDRFVLSCGHASMLQYALLHLAGYDLSLDDIRNFRQLGAKTAGHPEYGHAPGVETTTGPLGQGLANAVGMAMAQRHMAARFNRPNFRLFDGRIAVIASDGDLMEGIASEAGALAGHLQLGRLLVFWDDNGITIDGSTERATSEDVCGRFAAQNWCIRTVADAEDVSALEAASTLDPKGRPVLVRVQSTIAYPAPNKQNTAGSHGAPLGADEVAATKQAMGWEHAPFTVPGEVAAARAAVTAKGQAARQAWEETLAAYRAAHPALAKQLDEALNRSERVDWHALYAELDLGKAAVATRKASGNVLTALAPQVPNLVGGSADLAGSNNTYLSGYADFVPEGDDVFVDGRPDNPPRNVCWGIREHVMGAAANGMALYGGVRPYVATFLIFSDYMRPAMRLAALMKQPVVYVFTHDSIGLGEDGPTHQPVEQLASLRAMPGLTIMRPCDETETAEAWRYALAADHPVALVLTRQNLPPIAPPEAPVGKGAYVVFDAEPKAGAGCDVALMASGSEVSAALEAAKAVADRNFNVRVISMPSWEAFEAQPQAYRDDVLPPATRLRVSVEAGSTFGWQRWVGETGLSIGIDTFGASGPAGDLFRHFGLDGESVTRRVLEALEARA